LRAARLAGAAEALRETIGAPLPPIYTAAHQQRIDQLHQQLAPADLARAWAEGRALPFDRAIEEALKDA
jgi:hypothetical protein